MQRDVDPRADAGARRDRSIDDEHAVVDHLRARCQRTQVVEELVVRRAAAIGEQARARREQRSRADRDQAMRCVCHPQLLAQFLREPLRGRDDGRRRLPSVHRRLTDNYDPRTRGQSLR